MSKIYVPERNEAARQMSNIITAVDDLAAKTQVLTKAIAEEGNRIGEGLAYVNQALAPASALIGEAKESAEVAQKSFNKIMEHLDAMNNVAHKCSLD